ncbi:MAG: ATP-dependent Clp protease proteolytic subunit [Gammaproteobacteria bacterium]|nr:ATP-dependent Clp protease proteolytic subunit [Gammaproteobacteria bacterium]
MSILDKYNRAEPLAQQSQEFPEMRISMEGYELLAVVGDVASMEGVDLTPKDKRVGNENHTLFVKKMENEDGKEYYHYRLFLGPILEWGPSFNDLINPLYEMSEEDRLEIRIMASPGGAIDYGMALINVLNNQLIGRSTGILDSTAASMASSVYVNCHKRICHPHSTIMFHYYWGGAFGKGQELMAQADHHHGKFTSIIREHTVGKGFLTEEEFNRLTDGKDYWFDAKEMLTRGIATHIMFKGHDIEASEFLDYLSQNLSDEEILRLHIEKDHPELME